MNSSKPKTTKTYFITRDYDNKFPSEYVTSRNDRYISFQYCRATCNDSFDGETEVHASFVSRDEYCDSLVWYANLTPQDANRIYKSTLNHDRFRVWFTDSKGNEIIPDNFTLFLKFVY